MERRVLGRILEAAELSPQDRVVEVGPGLGLLTRELVNRVREVVAVEVDSCLAQALPQLLASPTNLTVLQSDILSLDLASLAGGAAYKVVANLPYYIAAPTIRRFLEAEVKPQLMVVMVQKEVARNILAEPGKLGILALAIQLYARPRLVTYVPSRSFYPTPKVDSAVLRLDVYPKPALDVDIPAFFQVVRGGFSAPRKQLRNSLAQGLALSPESVAGRLQGVGISPQRRPQTLSLSEWGAVWRAFAPALMGEAPC